MSAMHRSNKKMRAAILSIFSNSTLIVLKIIAGLLSGSVSIISEAIHSSMDLIASLVAFISVKQSSKPADRDHPFGHGKIENISGLIEGILIFFAAGFILVEAVKKLIQPISLEHEGLGIFVMLFAAAVNTGVSMVLYRVAKSEKSMAIEADALHLKTDVYTSLGVAFGVLLITLTKIAVLDPIVAIFVAGLIIKEAWEICRRAVGYLIDAKLPDELENQIVQIIERHNHQFINYHNLKTGHSGDAPHVDFHITFDPDMTILQSEKIISEICADIESTLPHCVVNIYIDPNEPESCI